MPLPVHILLSPSNNTLLSNMSNSDDDGVDNSLPSKGSKRSTTTGSSKSSISLNFAWDHEKVEKYPPGTDKWNCLFCETVFVGKNHTKALAHCAKQDEQSIAKCKVISDKDSAAFKDLANRSSRKKASKKRAKDDTRNEVEERNEESAQKVESKRVRKSASFAPSMKQTFVC